MVVVMLLLPVFVAWGPELAVPLLPAHAASGIFAPAAGDVGDSRTERHSSDGGACDGRLAEARHVGGRSRDGVRRGRGVLSRCAWRSDCDALARSGAARFRRRDG